MSSPSRDVTAEAVRRAVEDAVQAPSVHNTQPWRFAVRGSRISLSADSDRRLDVADPDGREMLISCGAALYNLRLSMRAQRFEPVVRLLPDPDRPHLLADVDMEPERVRAGDEVEREHAQIRRRHSHRGAFRPDPVAAEVLTALRHAAEREGARLIQAADAHVTGALAALTEAAEHIQQRTPSYAAEIARWAPAPATARKDGVQQAAYPRQTPRTEPHFPARDFARGQGWGVEPSTDDGTVRAGIVLLLVTGSDTPAAWLEAGQALQRVLLCAAEHDLAAAYHTQALQVPELRAFIRAHFCDDAHPQMLLRLGVPDGEELTTVRRPVEEVITQEP
ncbi:Acg family FMN-binding oxidoreductase [Actinomadura sp. 3N508]|uniref:Acg family FMN-binding oxidoreductase n=1 Tax=Actinomadura sp. 3N508 TaxID=3375153 RepID=UPI0037B8C427